MWIAGITGRIGTGKSTVLRWLAALGCVPLDSDALIHELYASDTSVHTALAAEFGPSVVRDGRVDRAALGPLVFGSPQALAALESITHPAVRRLREVKIEAARAAGAPGVAVEAIKLVESGSSAICDELWIVTAAEPVQLKRLEARGVNEAEARRRLASQGTITSWTEGFLAESDRLGTPRPVVIFDNSGSEETGRREVERLWSGIAAVSGIPPRAAP
jgi:dephospho-CoA kinase